MVSFDGIPPRELSPVTVFARLMTVGALAVCLLPAQPPAGPREPLPPLTRDLAANPPYVPITGAGRLRWVVLSSVGPRSLAVGALNSGWRTAFNRPVEYGGTWEGFGRRYGLRQMGVATGSAIEAGLGAAWGEDPRYPRHTDPRFWPRVGHAVKMTFAARRPDGSTAPAYARMTANLGNNFLSNRWRADSESTVSAALIRSGFGIASRIAGNLFDEFWPTIRSLRSRPKTPAQQPLYGRPVNSR